MVSKEYFGEDKNIEFKREIPNKHEKFLKDIIAFSNSTGGKVILGIEDETCVVYGIGEQSPFKLWGTGIPRIINRCKEYGLQEPLLEELGDGFMVTMFRKPTNQTNQTNQSNQNEMLQEHKSDFSDLEKKIIELLKAQPDVTTKEIMKKLEITDNQVKYYVKKLKDDGKIKRVGTNRKGSWKVM